MKPFYPSGKRGTELALLLFSWMFTRPTTFPFFYAHLRTRAPGVSARRRLGGRGFTLIELMVVVVIITLVSTIAIPGVVLRMKTNRTKQAAEDLAITFRQARIRAVGRTSAVLVRYNAGIVEVREAIQGNAAAAAGCEALPEASCLLPANRWANNNRSQRIQLTDYVAGGDFSVVATDDTGTVVTQIDVCFAPSGRAFIRPSNAAAVPFGIWTGPLRFDVDRLDNVGIRRSVLAAASGTARVVAAP